MLKRLVAILVEIGSSLERVPSLSKVKRTVSQIVSRRNKTAGSQGWLSNNWRGQPIHGKPAECFIQWKGTDVCFDFHCPCGYDGHFDGYFAYAVKCKRCGSVYEMPANVYPRLISPNENARPVIPDQEGELPPPSDIEVRSVARGTEPPLFGEQGDDI